MRFNVSSLNCFLLIVFGIAALAHLAQAQDNQGDKGSPPVVQEEDTAENKELLKNASRILGYRFYEDIKQQYSQVDVELDFDEFLKGIQQAKAGEELGLSDEQLRTFQTAFSKYIESKTQAAFRKAVDKNTREGEAFLKQNATAEGVKVLESGLQYKELTNNAEGAIPTKQDRVKVHYTGKFTDGEVFESSREAGQPAMFPVSGVVPGMSEALQRMNVGDKWMIYLPAKLGYGMQGTSGAIGPNQVIIFELELLEIVK